MLRDIAPLGGQSFKLLLDRLAHLIASCSGFLENGWECVFQVLSTSSLDQKHTPDHFQGNAGGAVCSLRGMLGSEAKLLHALRRSSGDKSSRPRARLTRQNASVKVIIPPWS